MTSQERQQKHDEIEELMLSRIKELSNPNSYSIQIPEGSTKAVELQQAIENYKEFIKARQFGRTISKQEMDAEPEVRSTDTDISSLFDEKDN